jgi:HEAT repeat protein
VRQAKARAKRGVAIAAAVTIGQFGSQAEELVPELIQRLADSNTVIREAAVRTLGEMGITARAARPALLAQLKDKDQSVRKLVESALERIRE